MSSDTKKIIGFAAKSDDYDALVIDFLDREISASNKSPAGQETHQDDLDTEVTDFLKKVASLEAETGAVAESDLENPGATGSTIHSNEGGLDQKLIDHDSEQSYTFGSSSKEMDPPGKAGISLRLVESFPKQQSVEQEHMEAQLDQDQDAAQATGSSSQVAGNADVLEDEKRAELLLTQSDPQLPSAESLNLPFAAPSPLRSKRRFMIGGVVFLAVVSIGAGAYYFGGFRAAPAAKESKTISPTIRAVPTKVADTALQHESPAAAARPSDKSTQTANPVAESTTSRQPESGAVPNPTAKSGAKEKPAPTPTLASRPAATSAPSAPAAVTGNPTTASAGTRPGNADRNPIALPVANLVPTEPASAAPVQAESAPPTTSIPPPVVATPAPASNVTANPAKTEVPAAPVFHEVSPSVPTSKVLPIYPDTARRMKVEGKVDVDAQVDEQGKVVKATAINGHFLLQAAAVEAVRKWKFKPAALNGKNVPSVSRVSVIFKFQP